MLKKISVVMLLLLFSVLLSGCDIENIINKFTKKVYIINYSAEEGGSIVGDLSQNIEYGKDATSVTAVPNELFVFLKWSDNLTTATRTDTNVIQNMNILAIFQRTGIFIDNDHNSYEDLFTNVMPGERLMYLDFVSNNHQNCYIRLNYEISIKQNDVWFNSNDDLNFDNWIKKDNYYYSFIEYQFGDVVLGNVGITIPTNITQSTDYKVKFSFKFMQTANIALEGTDNNKIAILENYFS